MSLVKQRLFYLPLPCKTKILSCMLSEFFWKQFKHFKENWLAIFCLFLSETIKHGKYCPRVIL